MSFVSRGFRRRHTEPGQEGRVPPGQYVTRDFPVLSAGPTPHTPLDEWSFAIAGEVDEPRRWSWDEFRALPSEAITKRHPLRDQVVEARHATGRASRSTRCSTGSRHPPSSSSPSATAATRPTCRSRTSPAARPGSRSSYDGEPLEPEHGGPARLLVPHLYFWKSAKWVRGLQLRDGRRAGLLGGQRLPQLRRSVAGAALLRATDAGSSPRSSTSIDETPRVKTHRAATSRTGRVTAPASTSTSG